VLIGQRRRVTVALKVAASAVVVMRCARAWCGSRCAMRGLEDRQSDRCHRRGTSPSAPLQSRRDHSPHNSPARWCWPSWMSSTMLHSWAAEPFSDAAMTTRFCTWCGVSTGCVIAPHPKEKPGAEIVRDQASRGGNWPLMPKLWAARSRVLLTVRMSEVSPRASLTHAFADLHCVFGLICRLVRAAMPSKCQSSCVA
jgi:hypothetical protein